MTPATIWLLIQVVFGPIGCRPNECNELYAVTHMGSFARREVCLDMARHSAKANQHLWYHRYRCIEEAPRQVIP